MTRRGRLPEGVYAFLTLVFGLQLFGLAIFVIPTSIDLISGNGRSATVEQRVAYSHLERLDIDADGCDERECLVTFETMPVQTLVLNASSGQVLLDLAKQLLPLVFAVAIVLVLRRLIGSVREGDPFTRSNVRRVRILGLLFLIGTPVIAAARALLEKALASTTRTGVLGVSDVPNPGWTPLILGAVVLILAEVFAHGVRLREDVEGTV